MNDFDLDRLGGLWRADPDPEEIRRLERSAAKARKRGRLAAMLDMALALLIAAVVIGAVAVNPERQTVMAGGAALLILLLSHVRQRRLREVELQSLASDTGTMLDQSIARLDARLKRMRLGLVAIGPATLIGAVFASALDQSSGGEFFQNLWRDEGLRGPVVIGAVMLVAATVVQMFVSLRRSRRELDRLRELRAAYAREQNGGTDNSV
ncbi:MAG: hypothetical protein ACK4K7_04175 [Allosphingosinicella sp.]|uniref:hypothetical protein n=1 Tax=Allosphingosinicella sp. TaxID=2823234 RepID=UPI003933EC56